MKKTPHPNLPISSSHHSPVLEGPTARGLWGHIAYLQSQHYVISPYLSPQLFKNLFLNLDSSMNSCRRINIFHTSPAIGTIIAEVFFNALMDHFTANAF